MPKVIVIQVIYNNRRFIEPVFSAIFNQTYKNIHVVAVISGNDDHGKELLTEKFPQVEIIDPGYNIGFSKGHNLVFEKYQSDLFQLVNPDFIMEPDYIERMVKVFEDEKVGAATGKLLRCNFGFPVGDGRDPLRLVSSEASRPVQKTNILDTTGVSISKSGRARDRGQHEIDRGQYDNELVVDAVSGAGCAYRRTALEAVKCQMPNAKGQFEYFDEDFHSYWEDVDLAWRLRNAGWKCVFVPEAVGYHGRGAGSSKNGYADVSGFIKHHKMISPRVKQLNYKNHIFMYVKNSRHFYPQFFIREFFMLGYIVLFEISTLKILPEMFRQLPKMWRKRQIVQRPGDVARSC